MRICVFCGSQPGDDPAFAAQTVALAELLVEKHIGIVYGGGRTGLMGVLADRAVELGGEVIGVIPHALETREIAHPRLTKLHVVESMHARKALMAELADGFITLPGGYGTLEELCEIITWSQLGFHRKPCGLVNVAGYYDSLIAMFDSAARHGFVSAENRSLVVEAPGPETVLARVVDLIARRD